MERAANEAAAKQQEESSKQTPITMTPSGASSTTTPTPSTPVVQRDPTAVSQEDVVKYYRPELVQRLASLIGIVEVYLVLNPSVSMLCINFV